MFLKINCLLEVGNISISHLTRSYARIKFSLLQDSMENWKIQSSEIAIYLQLSSHSHFIVDLFMNGSLMDHHVVVPTLPHSHIKGSVTTA